MHVQSTVFAYLPTQTILQPFLVSLSLHTPHPHVIPPWLPPSLDRGRREAPGWCHRLPKHSGEPQWKIHRKQPLGPRNSSRNSFLCPRPRNVHYLPGPNIKFSARPGILCPSLLLAHIPVEGQEGFGKNKTEKWKEKKSHGFIFSMTDRHTWVVTAG